MPFLILGLFIIVLSVISSYRKRHDRIQKETTDSFWEREAAANSVRRQDISGLPYITIPFEKFSIGSVSDEALEDALHQLDALREKKILNLGSQSNTDLKLQYGPANLPILMECDQNFADMLHAITAYSNRLIELGMTEKAIPVLEFAVASGSDVSTHYTTLATYYKDNGTPAKISELKTQAESLDSLMKTSILQKLNTIEAES